MTRILLRSPKSPFEVVTPRAAYERNLIGNNSGNLIFIHATYKVLATRGTTIGAGGFSTDPELAGEVNERYDAYVLPLANAFRLSFEQNLSRITRFIEGLTIPVTVLGVGAQLPVSGKSSRLKPIAGVVSRFVRAVLERGPTIGVRGEMTAGYLADLGFRDVEVIGCPSMFLYGDQLRVEKRLDALDRTARISMNVSPYLQSMGPIVSHHLAHYPNLTYIAQDIETLGLLVNGEPHPVAPDRDPLPTHLSHPVFQDRRVRFYVEPWPWLRDLGSVDYSFGSRIHGNIAAILAGTPATVLAHDARTLELARYFAIPHRVIERHPAPDRRPLDAEELYAEANLDELLDGHGARFATFAGYLERHRLAHVFAEGEDPEAFDRKVDATPHSPAVVATRRLLVGNSLAGRVLRVGREIRPRADSAARRARRIARRLRRELGRLRRTAA